MKSQQIKSRVIVMMFPSPLIIPQELLLFKKNLGHLIKTPERPGRMREKDQNNEIQGHPTKTSCILSTRGEASPEDDGVALRQRFHPQERR